MKPNLSISRFFVWLFLSFAICGTDGYAQVCSDPANVIYGLTNTGDIYPITVSTGFVGAKINPPYTGNVPDISNAMGYSNLNGKFYYFKRSPVSPPQEFVSFDPASNIIAILDTCPSINRIHLGCLTADGQGYYCLDMGGNLFYYDIALNKWTKITSIIQDESATNLSAIVPDYVGGDLAIDGNGNMWILISSGDNFGLYKLNGPLPKTNVASVTVQTLLPITTATPSGSGIAGIAFNNTGQIFVSTLDSDELYRVESNTTLTYLSKFTVPGVGNDLTSCNYPLALLAGSDNNFYGELIGQNVQLSWKGQKASFYQVQLSFDGIRWQDLAVLPGSGTLSRNNMSFTHTIQSNDIYYYRLCITTPNQSLSYSAIKSFRVKTIPQVSIFPNPVQTTVNIEVKAGGRVIDYEAVIYDLFGRQQGRIKIKPGSNKFDFNYLNAGNYILKISSQNGESYNAKIVKQ